MKKTIILWMLATSVAVMSFSPKEKSVEVVKDADLLTTSPNCRELNPDAGWSAFISFVLWDTQMQIDYPQVPRTEDHYPYPYFCGYGQTGYCNGVGTRVCYG